MVHRHTLKHKHEIWLCCTCLWQKENPRYVELLHDGQVECIVLPFTADGTAGIAPSFILCSSQNQMGLMRAAAVFPGAGESLGHGAQQQDLIHLVAIGVFEPHFASLVR